MTLADLVYLFPIAFGGGAVGLLIVILSSREPRGTIDERRARRVERLEAERQRLLRREERRRRRRRTDPLE